MKRTREVVVVSHRTSPTCTSNHRGLTITEREDALERGSPTSVRNGESYILIHKRRGSRRREARNHKRRSRECECCWVSWKDSPSMHDVKKHRATLNDRDVSNKTKVARQGIIEYDVVLALNYEAGNVEGSKAYRRPHEGHKVPSPRKIVQTSRNIH